MDIGIGNNGCWQHFYRSAALRRKKRAEDEAGMALAPLGARGSVAGLAPVRALIGKSSDWTNRPTVVAVVVVVPVDAARNEVEVPRVARIARIRRRGPVVAVRAGAAEARVVAEAGSRKEDALVRV